MQSFITTALLLSFITSTLILVLSLIFSLFKATISPKVQYWTWVILFVALLVPFRPTFGNGLIQLPSSTEVVQQVTQQVTQQAPTAASQATPDIWTQILGLPWLTILASIWLIGVLFHLGKHTLAYYKFRQLIARWGQEIEDLHILEQFFDMKQRLGIKDDIALIHYPAGHSPMMTGLRNPKVLLPETNYTDEELELIFEHELTHYLHRDIYVNLLGILVTSLHWFNPIVRFAYKEIQEAGEIYCDYDVLQQRDANYRTFYGETIITMINQSQKQPVALTTCFYSNKFRLKRRITAIMTNKLPKRLLSTGLLVLIPLSLLLSGSIFAFTSQQAERNAQQESTVSKSENKPAKPEKNTITQEDAIKIALAEVKLNANQVKNLAATHEKDYYQVSFQTDSEQFVSRINNQNGQVLSMDKVSIKQPEQVTTPAQSTPVATPPATNVETNPAPTQEYNTPASTPAVSTPAYTPSYAPSYTPADNDVDDDHHDDDDDDDTD